MAITTIILAAGYATRLYPITINTPKPLLQVGNNRIIDYLLDKLRPIHNLNQCYIVTNAKFFDQFLQWLNQSKHLYPFEIQVINDNTTDESNRLGAIGDLNYVINQKQIGSDICVAAGDNLFTTDLTQFFAFCNQKQAPVVGVYDIANLQEIKKYSSVALDSNNMITYFEEKPINPKTTLAAIGLYFYPAKTIQLIQKYIAENNNHDQPGRLVQWLYTTTPVFGWLLQGKWFDIGSFESLEDAKKCFSSQP